MATDYKSALRDLLESSGGEYGIADSSDETADHIETTEEGPKSKPEIEAKKTKPFSKKNMFVHHDTHPILLDMILLEKYELSWFDWEPETVWRSIMKDFQTSSISDHVKSKIQAVRTTHITDLSFTRWETFSVITQALNNNIPDFEVMRRPTISQLFTAVDMMESIRNDVPFSEEVGLWCAAAMIDAGVICAPQPLAFCQEYILEIQKNRGNPVNPDPVKEKYRYYLSTPKEEVRLEETDVDIQTAKLIIARDYMTLRRQQLSEQLKIL